MTHVGPAGAPTPEAVTGYLLDAARQGCSVWSVVNVVKHFVEAGLTRRQVLAALRAARAEAPALAALLRDYERNIRLLL